MKPLIIFCCIKTHIRFSTYTLTNGWKYTGIVGIQSALDHICQYLGFVTM